MSYDSGAGSFQIVALMSEETPSIARYRTHQGPFGEIFSLEVLAREVRGASFCKNFSPNPVRRAEADELIEKLVPFELRVGSVHTKPNESHCGHRRRHQYLLDCIFGLSRSKNSDKVTSNRRYPKYL